MVLMSVWEDPATRSEVCITITKHTDGCLKMAHLLHDILQLINISLPALALLMFSGQLYRSLNEMPRSVLDNRPKLTGRKYSVRVRR